MSNLNTHPISMIDLTIPEKDYTVENLINIFKKNFTKWCFQKEKGNKTDYIHYQFRGTMITRRRINTMIKWINEILPGSHASPTANATKYKGNMLYVMKDDTRIEGPWTNKDEESKVDYIPERFRGEITWNKMQQKILEKLEKKPDDRTVDCLIDENGNNGKSFLGDYLAVHKKARTIPNMKSAQDVLRMVMNLPKANAYFIDFPRALGKNDQHAMYGAIEIIKKGYAYDDRYHFKEEWFEPPHVWVFTNNVPDLNLLSKDRWKLWTISNEELKPWNNELLEKITTNERRKIIRNTTPIPRPPAGVVDTGSGRKKCREEISKEEAKKFKDQFKL